MEVEEQFTKDREAVGKEECQIQKWVILVIICAASITLFGSHFLFQLENLLTWLFQAFTFLQNASQRV